MIPLPKWPPLRASEWILIGYFGYVALISPFFHDRPHLGAQPFFEVAIVFALLILLAAIESRPAFAKAVSVLRDWLPILLTLVAFREMEWFLPPSYPRAYEATWARQDHVLLTEWHLRSAIEYLGAVVPFYLECCYLLVYGVAAASIGILYGRGKRELTDRFLALYLLGTLAAYALFPYFPSQPPRIAFPLLDRPDIVTWARRLNLFILRKGTIHVGVFPSAHVSSAFSAAWAMFLVLPERKRFGWAFLLYAVSVSLATIYGRYHYSADVLAGFLISLIPAAIALAASHLLRS